MTTDNRQTVAGNIARRICAASKDGYDTPLIARVWSGGGEVRLYVRTVYAGIGCGYAVMLEDGGVGRRFHTHAGVINEIIDAAIKGHLSAGGKHGDARVCGEAAL